MLARWSGSAQVHFRLSPFGFLKLQMRHILFVTPAFVKQANKQKTKLILLQNIEMNTWSARNGVGV